MDGAGLKKQVGVHCPSSQPARPGVPYNSLGLQMGDGHKGRHSPVGPHCPHPHLECVVKMERTADRKGGLRGQRSAPGAKERCFTWEGKAGKNTQTFLSLQGCQSPALSFFRGKCCTFGFE